MDHKKAAAILISLLDKRLFDADEKEAVLIAIGVLGWTSLSESKLRERAKARRAKKNKDTEWR